MQPKRHLSICIWSCRRPRPITRRRSTAVLTTMPVAATKLGAATVSIGGVEEPVRNAMLRLTQVFNITGHPAITLPCGRTNDNLPVGAQLVGERTPDLLAIAAAIEHALE